MKYFGTDGIRGVVDDTVDYALAYQVGKSLAVNILKKKLPKQVLIGKDTRTSGDVLSHALACGLMDYGIDALMLGVVPTACTSYLCTRLNIGYGIMITASHNVSAMNGIKVMNRLGYKLTDDQEREVEQEMDDYLFPKASKKGQIRDSQPAVLKYEQFVLEHGLNLTGANIALDCANGSNYALAMRILKKLGANVVAIGCENLGEKINENCGALHPERLKQEVLLHHCDIGFAFDGDADRLVIILKDGKELMGDELLYLFAKQMKEHDELNSLTVVGTIMTNLGCEESLSKLGISLERVDVGDKNVIERMNVNNYVLGGESSGHICLGNLNTTCDALLNALQLLKIVHGKYEEIPQLLLSYQTYPSLLKNVEVDSLFRQSYNENQEFHEKLKRLIAAYPKVKIVVRPSGTESVIRILAESADANLNQKVVCHIEKFIKNYTKMCCERKNKEMIL